MPRTKLKKFLAIRQISEIFDFSKESYQNWKQADNKTEFLKKQLKLPEVYFENGIILEVGAGFGEYTNLLSQVYSNNICFGVEIKGERLYTAYFNTINTNKNKPAPVNTFWLQTQADQLLTFFDPESVSQIWLTFSDPQPNKPKQRLTSLKHFEIYLKLLQKGGAIYIKTDSQIVYDGALSYFQKHSNLILAKDFKKDGSEELTQKSGKDLNKQNKKDTQFGFGSELLLEYALDDYYKADDQSSDENGFVVIKSESKNQNIFEKVPNTITKYEKIWRGKPGHQIRFIKMVKK
jgi:tRNA (guanine-N7-)-methyltransferase